MKFETASVAAERLGVNIRTVQKWAKLGKLAGAMKVGRDWMIPEGAIPSEHIAEDIDTAFLPFALGSFECGKAMEFARGIENEDERNIAIGECYYHMGQCEKAVEVLEKYLDSPIHDYQLAATLICFFSYLSLGHKHQAHLAVNSMEKQLKEFYHINADEEMCAKGVFVCSMLSTLLHFSSNRIPQLENYVNHLHEGIKALSLYAIAYKAYLEKDYSRAYGIGEAALIVCPQNYVIARIHIHIISAVSLMGLTRVRAAKEHLKIAWELAKKDGFYQPFAEHHSVLHGLLESYIKKEHPQEFAVIIEIAKNYGKSWRGVHNETMNKTVADNLTTTEFVVATLYYRDWRIKEIADHMNLSEKTIKNYLQIIYQKLGINGKKGLEEFMMN